MMRWKNVRFAFGVLFIISISQFAFHTNPVQAIRPNENGCMEYSTGVVCPDLYCSAELNSSSCSLDGQQCFCKPAALQKTIANKDCEIAFGSSMYYINTSLDSKPTIYLTGGIWNALIESIESTGKQYSSDDMRNNFDLETSETKQKAIIFRYQSGEKIQHYSSRFLSLIVAKGAFSVSTNSVWKLGFDAQINIPAGTGRIFNQTFETQSDGNSSPKTQICNVSEPTIGSGQDIFYNKQSTVLGNNRIIEPNRTACIMGPKILASLILPSSEKSFLLWNRDVTPLFNSSRNCSSVDQSKFMTPETAEIDMLTGGLVVPSNRQRSIFRQYQPNYYMGEVFPRAYTPTEQSERQSRIGNIKNYCTTTCNLEKIKTDMKLDSTDDAKQFLPSNCTNCQNTAILDELEARPASSYNDLLAESLLSDDNQCRLVSPSYGHYDKSLNPPKFSTKDDTRIVNGKAKTETDINNQLPLPLTNACEDRYQNDTRKRLDCKANALKCYQASLVPDLRSSDLCYIFDKQGLGTAKWIMCPILTTSVLTADGATLKIDEILKTNPYALGSSTKNIWYKFRDIANIGLILAFIILIGSQVTSLGLSNYQIKKMIPKIIIVAFLINVSFYFAQVLLDISNILGSSIASFIQGTYVTQESPGSFSDIIMKQIIGVGSPGGTSMVLFIGVLGIFLPMLLIAFIGLLGVLLLFAIRQSLIIILVIVSPIVCLALAFSKSGEKLFSQWLRTYLVSILTYPIAQFVYASAKLAYQVIWQTPVKSGGGLSILKIIAMLLPLMAMVSIPFIFITLLKSSSKLAGKLVGGGQSYAAKLGAKTNQHSSNSTFTKVLKSNRSKQWRRFKTGQMSGGLAGRGASLMSNILGSKAFNTITSGAGKITNSQGIAANKSAVKSIVSTIDGDFQLAHAIIKDRGEKGAIYQNLNNYQKQKYDRAISIGKTSGIYNIPIAAIQAMASSGVSSYEAYDDAFILAHSYGATNRHISDAAVTSMLSAKRLGDTDTMGYMFAKMKHQNANSRILTPPKSISILSEELLTNNDLQETNDADKSRLLVRIIDIKGDLSKLDELTLTEPQKIFREKLINAGLGRKDILTAAVIAASNDTTIDKLLLNSFIEKGIEYLAYDGEITSVELGSNELVNPTDAWKKSLSKKRNIAYAKLVKEYVEHNLENKLILENGELKIDSEKLKFTDKLKNDFEEVRTQKNDITGLKLKKGKYLESSSNNWTETTGRFLPPTKQKIYAEVSSSISMVGIQNLSPLIYQPKRRADALINQEAYGLTLNQIKSRLNDPSGDNLIISQVATKWNYLPVIGQASLEKSLRNGLSKLNKDESVLTNPQPISTILQHTTIPFIVKNAPTHQRSLKPEDIIR